MKQLSDIDWSGWQAKDPATLVFVFRDDEILLINKKTGSSFTNEEINLLNYLAHEFADYLINTGQTGR